MSSTNESNIDQDPSSSNRITRYFGMSVPYNFSIAVPALVAAGMLLLIITLEIAMTASSKLTFGTPRGTFFVYLTLMAVAAILFARKPKMSWVLIAVLFLELSLGFIPYFARQIGIPISRDLLPANENSRFEYHPLLQGVPIPNYSSTLPGGGPLTHTSFGTRGPEPSATDLASKPIITAYGGSTTYDIFVSDEEAWPNQLSNLLDNKAVLINRGVPGYNTVENLIQTTFYDQVNGRTPACALYYEGWNDVQGAYLPNLDPAYADFHLLNQIDGLQVRKGSGFSPLTSMISRLPVIGQETIPLPPSYANLEPGEGADPRLEEILRRNVQSIIATNSARGTKSVFIGQVLNSTDTTYDSMNGWAPLVKDEDVIAMVDRLNVVMKEEAIKSGAAYIDVPNSGFSAADFVDNGHFSPAGSSKFANSIAAEVQQNCF
jgi:lysophospholipase L1-like esterase